MADHDVVVIGAGFAGLYAVHKLRDDLGLDVQAFDAAAGPGGTWYWNRYPGARCDFESVHYSYSFSPDIQREWQWSERFAAQPEILRYLEWVADRLDVRRAYRFSTRVTSMVWDDDAAHWTIGTDDGGRCTARFVVSGAGNLAVAKANEFPGEERFRGQILRTSAWPHEPVDLSGKRVGVVGTGSTGLQVIPEVAEQAAHLTVFQRSANFAAPLGNRKLSPEESRWQAEHFEEVRAGARENFIGAPYEAPKPSALLDSPEERKATYDRFYEGGGFRLVVSTYQDLLLSKEANDTIADYLRDRIRERVHDPATAELLCPTDHAYATKRAPFETGYFETFNRPDVELVDVRSAPIAEITPTGLRTAAREYELDVIILATGFDAITGTLLRMGVVGRDGMTLEQAWADGPRSYLGLQSHGFPNLFTITGPQSATALYNNPLAIEDHVELSAAAISHVLASGARTIEPTAEAESAWGAMAEGVLNMTLIPQSATSWYMGANIPGKRRSAYIFAGGAPLYRAICTEMEARGFAGLAVDGAGSPVGPMIEVDPAVALVLGAMIGQGAKPLEECTVEETRAAVESMTMLQAPRREVRVEHATYPSASGDPLPARVYRPAGAEGALPVLVFFHPGGWIAGSVEVADEPCRALAEELQAVVVSAGYRLAPEHPFPAATDDTYAALCWAAANAADFGGDPQRLVVMGESAGANLAAVAAQRARDEDGPQLTAQVLLYPPIDADAQTASKARYAAGPFLSAAAADGMWTAYLGDRANAASPLASPSRATSLAGLAPALLLSAECDPTRDEAEQYGAALAEAGVPTDVRRMPGMIHGAFNMSGLVPRTHEFHRAITEFLQPLLAPAEAAV